MTVCWDDLGNSKLLSNLIHHAVGDIFKVSIVVVFSLDLKGSVLKVTKDLNFYPRRCNDLTD